MPNSELLHETMDFILAHPEKHNQGYWSLGTECGTAHCFAGWALILSGMTLSELAPGDNDYRTPNGRFVRFEAKRVLRLDKDQATRLFHGFNTVTDLKHIVDDICDTGRVNAQR